jgi:hypothetical protein
MHRLDELEQWVSFGDGDVARLAAMWPLVRPETQRIVDAFYVPVLAAPRAREILRDEAQIARLRAMLAAWLEELLCGPYDPA